MTDQPKQIGGGRRAIGDMKAMSAVTVAKQIFAG